MFVDDLAISCSHSNYASIQNILQSHLKRLESFSQESGLEFNVSKTIAISFSRGKAQEPPLQFNNHSIRYQKEVKYLGIWFDQSLNFIAHLKDVKEKAMKSSNILKILSNSRFGSDSELLIKLYRVMTLPIIQYGSIAYETSNTKAVKTLDAVNNLGIRLALGAFRTSPTDSLLALVNQKTLEQSRLEFNIKFMLKTLSIKDNPVADCVAYSDTEWKPKFRTGLHELEV